MLLLALVTAAVFILILGMFVGAWLEGREFQGDYEDALASLRRIRGA